MGAASGSPAKSEPGAQSARSKLLKSALSNSKQGRRRGGNNSLVEITNRTLDNLTPSLDASADTTMRKKGRAMAQFKASQEEETPRTIMSNFMEAHKEEAVNSSELFSRGRVIGDQSLGASYSTRDRSSRHINANSLISDSSHQEDAAPDVSADISSGSSPGGVAKHLKRKTGSRRRNVTTEELDPDRDISRPTNRSMGDHTAQGSDGSPNETKAPPKRSRRTRAQVNYNQDDFDFTNLTLRQDTLHVSDTSLNASSIRQKKRPDNKAIGTSEDFEGLSPVAHALGEVSPDRTRLTGKRPKVPKKLVDPAEFSNLTGEQREEEEEGDRTLVQTDHLAQQDVEEDSMELTKIGRRKRIERNKFDTVEFSNISVGLEGNESAEQTPKAQTSKTIYEGSMEETRVQPRRRTRKTAEVEAAEFTNISYQAGQSKSGTDSKMEVEEPSVGDDGGGGENALGGGGETVLGGSMEETRLQRRSRKQAKDADVDVANFTDLTVSEEVTIETTPQAASFLKSGQEIPESDNLMPGSIELEKDQMDKQAAQETSGTLTEEMLDNLMLTREIIDNVESAQPDTSENEKEESRRSAERVARAARNPEIAAVARSPCLSNIGEESEEAGHGSRQQSRASGEMALLLPPDLTEEPTATTETLGALRHARRSVYEAGQPEAPLEGSLSLGDSRADPAGESTRLGGVRSPQFAAIVNSPAGAARLFESLRVQVEAGTQGRSLGKSLQEQRQGRNEVASI